MAKAPVTFSFDGRNEAAVQAALGIAAKLVKQISVETEQNIRDLITRAIAEGVTPVDTAVQIRAMLLLDATNEMVGLTTIQGNSLAGLRQELLKEGLSLNVVNSKIAERAIKLRSRRANTIARTEILKALNNGQDEAFKQAQAQGLLRKDALKEVVLTVGACSICLGVAREGPKPIGHDFSQPGPPFHPQCRCTIALNLSPLSTKEQMKVKEIDETLTKRGWEKSAVKHTDGSFRTSTPGRVTSPSV